MTIKFQAKTKEGWFVDSPLQAFTFPDGATHIKGADAETRYQYQIADVRGLNNTDYITLIMWAKVCRERGETSILLLPYLPGARADRGTPSGSEVYARMINDIGATQVIGLDPHSPIMPGMVRNYKEFPFERIIKNEVADRSSDSKPNPGYAGVIVPDTGAIRRATRAAKVLGVPFYIGGKSRDFETGKLTGFHMEDVLPAEGRFLIVDDICDGGGTFIGLAEAIRKKTPGVVLDLWVTHGIFSKGLVELVKYFDVIHTTDSYFQVDKQQAKDSLIDLLLSTTTFEGSPSISDHFVVHNITPYLYSEIENHK
ncbi:MAG: hypothetical protein ACRC5T_10700 [Cetobacterium sp.]